MKILYISDKLPLLHKNTGGAEKAASNLINLARRSSNHEILYATTSYKAKPGKGAFIIKTTEDYLPFLRKIIRAFKNRIFNFDLVSFFSALRLWGGIKPDLIHFHKFNILSFSLICAARIRRIPTVLSIYDYWYFSSTIFLLKGEERYSLWRKVFFRPFMERIDRFVVLSENSKSILMKFGIPGQRIVVIPQVMHVARREAAAPLTEKGFILFAGWLTHYKGADTVIRALPEVLKKVPSARLEILGMKADLRYQQKLFDLVYELKLRERVSFYGRLTPDEFSRRLNEASVIVVPERWPNMSPVIVAEAMARGKAIVASRIGGIPEFIADGSSGLLAEPDNPADFAEKISMLLKDREKTIQFGKNARLRAYQIFDPEAIQDKLNRVYEDLRLL